MARLFDMASSIRKHGIELVLIQIDEAHSTAWPRAVDSLLNIESVESHSSIDDRINRAKYFLTKYKPPYKVYVDVWNNNFAELFHAWPDKYHCVDKNLALISKSTYHGKGDNEARVIVDVTVMLEQMMNM